MNLLEPVLLKVRFADLHPSSSMGTDFLNTSPAGSRFIVLPARKIDLMLAVYGACGIGQVCPNFKGDWVLYLSWGVAYLPDEQGAYSSGIAWLVIAFWCSAHMLLDWRSYSSARMGRMLNSYVGVQKILLVLKGAAINDPEDLVAFVWCFKSWKWAAAVNVIVSYGLINGELECLNCVKPFRKEGKNVVWSSEFQCMANTVKVNQRVIKRAVWDILKRAFSSSFRCHSADGSYAGGVHFEMTVKM